MKGRKAQNRIKMLTTVGLTTRNTKAIINEIVGYYKKLSGDTTTHLSAVHPAVVRNGPVLTRGQQLKLINIHYC